MSVVLYCPERAWRNAFFMYIDKNEHNIPFLFGALILAYVCVTILWELWSRPAPAPPGRSVEKIKAERLQIQHAILALEQHVAKLDAELGALSPSLDKRPVKRARGRA